MGKYQQLIKLFVVLFFSTAFIFSFSHFGAQAFEKITSSDGKFAEGTAVGSVDVSGKSQQEAITLLEEKYIEWLTNTKYQLQYVEKVVPFDLNSIHFDSALTVSLIKDGQQNAAAISIDLLEVENQINVFIPEVDTTTLELTKLIEDLTAAAKQFKTGEFSFNINTDYLLVDNASKNVLVSEAIIELEEVPFDLESVIENNPELKIEEEADFSLVAFAKQQKLEKSSSLSVIATGIYQAILPTNFLIAERNISSSLPKYAGLGYEAMVSVGKGMDLVITNPNKSIYTIELKLENKKLIITLKGQKFLYDYEISKKDEQDIKPKTIVQYSPLLLPGKTKVQNEGEDGKLVKAYRNIFQGGQLVDQQLISEDYYPPAYRVEIHGLTGTKETQTTEQNVIGENNSNGTEPIGTQPPLPSDNGPQETNDDTLWGKPNEERK